MTIYLRQSTASQEVPLGHFVDATDGSTAETGLTIANTDIKLWLTGATTLANKTSGGATHISGGVYYCVLDATDTATVGPLVIFVQVAGALPVRLECCVLTAQVYDSLIAGSDLLDVSMTQILGTAVATPTTAGVLEVDVTHWNGTAVASPHTAGYPVVTVKDGTGTGEIDTTSGGVLVAALASGAITAGSIAADAIGASELAADAVAEIADAVWDEALSGHVTAGTAGRALRMEAGTAQSATSTTIVLQSDESPTDDIHNGSAIVLIGGTGVGQAREITDYAGSSKTATVATWTTTPDSTTKYVILGN